MISAASRFREKKDHPFCTKDDELSMVVIQAYPRPYRVVLFVDLLLIPPRGLLWWQDFFAYVWVCVFAFDLVRILDVGDDTVPLRSLSVCTAWASTFEVKTFKNLDHMFIFGDGEFNSYIQLAFSSQQEQKG